MNIIANRTFDEERALYGSHDIMVKNCSFDGPADGESALKESREVAVNNVFLTFVIHFGMTGNLSLKIQR